MEESCQKRRPHIEVGKGGEKEEEVLGYSPMGKNQGICMYVCMYTYMRIFIVCFIDNPLEQ